MEEWPAGTSVIIPAHNEAASLPRLLRALTAGGLSPDLEILVVCNGCVDETAAAARSVIGVTVAEIDEASKRAALAEGNRRARHAVRAYIDADVVLSQDDLRLLVECVLLPGTLAAAPERELLRRQVSWPVRWYYDVWERLPQVRSGLFGRGVIVMARGGAQRVNSLPQMMSDDLVMSEAFTDGERRVVSNARVAIQLPRTVADLLRRRVRVTTGNAEMDQQGLRSSAASTSPRSLLRLLLQRPQLLPKVVVFGSVTIVARFRARRAIRTGDFQTWLRDESSRQP